MENDIQIDENLLKRMQELAVIRTLEESLKFIRSRTAYKKDGRTWNRLEIDFRDVEKHLHFRGESSGNRNGVGLQLYARYDGYEYRLSLSKNNKTREIVLSAGIYKVEKPQKKQ